MSSILGLEHGELQVVGVGWLMICCPRWSCFGSEGEGEDEGEEDDGQAG